MRVFLPLHHLPRRQAHPNPQLMLTSSKPGNHPSKLIPGPPPPPATISRSHDKSYASVLASTNCLEGGLIHPRGQKQTQSRVLGGGVNLSKGKSILSWGANGVLAHPRGAKTNLIVCPGGGGGDE